MQTSKKSTIFAHIMSNTRITFPSPLPPGGTVAIVSPATIVKEEFVEGAADFFRTRGYECIVMPSALGPSSGSFAAAHNARLNDLRDAVENPEVNAILCARGGYGCVHLIADSRLAASVADNPKWIVGFSDVSALHALWYSCGVASIHGPMAKHLSVESPDDTCSGELLRIMTRQPEMDYSFPSSPFNRLGCATGELRGGNLAVLNGLAGTPFDLLSVASDEDVILFIEDISEKIYAVERMLMRLYLSGSLTHLKGLIIGQFTEYSPDRNFESMEAMIDALLTRCGITDIPVAFNFPVGHVSRNYPLIEGAMVRLEVTPASVILKSIK